MRADDPERNDQIDNRLSCPSRLFVATCHYEHPTVPGIASMSLKSDLGVSCTAIESHTSRWHS